MKKARMTIWVMIVLAVSCICLTQNADAMIYDVPGEYIIDFAIFEDVTVTNPGTHVILIDGGSIDGSLRTEDGGQATITGGSISASILAVSSSPMTISGGIIGGGIALDSSSGGDVTIIGTDFEINGIPMPYGPLDGTIQYGQLSGTLLNGDLLGCGFGLAGANTIIFAPVPEPGTVALFGLGGLMLRRKR